MTLAMAAVRAYLRDQYAALLGEGFEDFLPRPGLEGLEPAYVPVDAELAACRAESTSGACVMDPEIGMCLYVLPFTGVVAMRACLRSALSVRSRLLREAPKPSGATDRRGAWRVVVHWLVDGPQYPEWLKEAATLRAQTSYFEEVPIESVVRVDGTWTDAISAFGFPRLLFATRRLLRLAKYAAATPWADVDRVVRDEVEALASDAASESERDAARELLNRSAQKAAARPAEADARAGSSTRVSTLRVRGFRNLEDMRIELAGESDPARVCAAVIHGPNGSGKSSIFEALSIALCGSSHRYVQFATSQRGRQSGDAADIYMRKYLVPFDAPGAVPQVGLDEGPMRDLQVCDAVNAEERLERLSGTVLAQETSAAFAAKDPRDFGAAIVGSASTLASDLLAYANRRYEEQRAKQVRMWDDLGIAKQVRTEKTARQRIAASVMRRELPAPTPFVAWAADAPQHMGQGLRTLAHLSGVWAAVDAGFQGVCELMARTGLHEGGPEEGLLLEVVSRRAKAARDTMAWAESVRTRTRRWPSSLSTDLRSWADWILETQKAPGGQGDPSAPARLEGALVRERTLRAGGLLARAHVAHLEETEKFLREVWASHRPQECPTCASDLASRGGAEALVRARLEEERGSVERLRDEYRRVSEEIKAIRGVGALAGRRACPISDARQVELSDLLEWIMPPGTSVGTWLEDSSRAAEVLRVIEWLRRLPDVPAATDDSAVDAVARALGRKIQDAFASVASVSAGEAAWKVTRARLSERLSLLMNSVIPSTVQDLWAEMVSSLTPAPWQLPGRLRFKVDAVRAQPEADIELEHPSGSRYARFVLNQSEVHALGLAWFLTRYLVEGRWSAEVLALDDPAQEMDQPMFRDMCRLLESLLRLHRVHRIPVTLVLLLHQDDRALDAARALGGVLQQVKWNDGSLRETSVVRLFREDAGAPFPELVTAGLST